MKKHVITKQEHYNAFSWCSKNNIKIYAEPYKGKFKLIYVKDGIHKSSNILHDKDDYMQQMWNFYLYLYKKFS
jgi:hypothetical protein